MPAAEAVARFAAGLDALAHPAERIGLAVSGGPDSLALLLLAAAARPGLVLVASVDHGLREGSRGEAQGVAEACKTLGVPHDTLMIAWDEIPASALQERARRERYAALGAWARANELRFVATGHHADDQAETLVMRLMRGAGVRGLAGMRRAAPLPGSPELVLLRPLLEWRRSELAAIVAAAGVTPSSDPSNHDPRHERVRVRRWLADCDWLDPAMLASSAGHLADADEAIEFAVDYAWALAADDQGAIAFRPGEAPVEIRRRLVARAIAALASEGGQNPLRGGEIDRLLGQLEAGRSATLRGVLASGGSTWRFTPAPARR